METRVRTLPPAESGPKAVASHWSAGWEVSHPTRQKSAEKGHRIEVETARKKNKMLVKGNATVDGSTRPELN